MENTKKDKETKEPEEVNILQSRVEINKVIIETPSLLNMIKHCQDKKGRASVAFLLAGNTGVQGSITGVIKTELGQNNIYVNNCIPDGSKQTRATLNQLRGEQAESKRKTETINEIGFYASSELGLAFDQKNLMRMIANYRDFRNSIMITYDLNKAQYGLNPIIVYRLSAAAIEALNLNNISLLTDQLVQENIRKHKLEVQNFFEEVPMKIHRTHLLQAFLFDHISPDMPSFNTRVFDLARNDDHNIQYLYKSNEQSTVLLEEIAKVEQQHKKMKQLAQKQNKKMQNAIVANKDKTVKGSQADQEDRQALESFKVVDDQDNKMDLLLFSKQVDTLYNSINEFGDCFPEKEFKAPAAVESK